MNRLNEKRLQLLKDVKNGSITRENLREKEYTSSNIKYFKKEGLVTGNLGSLQFTPEGFRLLNQKELSDLLKKFSKQSNKHDKVMLKYNKRLEWLTWAILVLTLINIIMALREVLM